MPRAGYVTRFNAHGYEVDFADTEEGRARAAKKGFTFTENPKLAKAEAPAAPQAKPKPGKA